jgi:methyl-accepting chemotaxis protein
MPDFVIHYDVLEAIAKSSNSLGRNADQYADGLADRIANAINRIEGPSSDYLENASCYVNEKITQLQKKSEEFYDFASQVTTLAETAAGVDKEVAALLAQSYEIFLQHHESLRIDDWKADILNWLTDLKNSMPFLEMLGKMK